MPRSFKKALILCPEKYSLAGSLRKTLENLADQVFSHDNTVAVTSRDKKIHAQMFRLPFRVRERWDSYFLKKINVEFISFYNELKPDLVLVYNSEFLTKESCEKIKLDSRLIFFLGDSPFYTTGNNQYLAILRYADLILSPDSFWIEQLNTIGIKKTMFFAPGLNNEQYFEIQQDKIGDDIPSCEILYTGMSYPNAWGYKKALFMSQFTGFDLRIYGSKHWKKWFRDFPDLEAKFIESGFIPVERLNAMMNRAKLIPVDGNPGILNGFHLRLLEALGAGALPLVEYRKDVENELFKGCRATLPLVRDYSEAAGLAAHFLENESERKALVSTLREHIIRNYSPVENASRIMNRLAES